MTGWTHVDGTVVDWPVMETASAQYWDAAYGSAELDLEVRPHPVLEEELGILPPGRGLELGCGEGRPALWLAGRGWRMTAVDFSAVAVGRGRTIAAARNVDLAWCVADVVEFDPPAPLDLVVIMYLHLPRPALLGVVERAAGALGPGGSLFVLGWDRSNAANGVGPRPHELQYSLDELERAAGLQVRRSETLPQTGSANAFDAVLHAVRVDER